MHGKRSFKQSLRVPRPEAVLTDEQLQNHFDAFDQLFKETGLPPIWNGKDLVAWKESHRQSIEFKGNAMASWASISHNNN